MEKVSRKIHRADLIDRKNVAQIGYFFVICLQYFFLFPLTASVGSDVGKVFIENKGKKILGSFGLKFCLIQVFSEMVGIKFHFIRKVSESVGVNFLTFRFTICYNRGT